ncbi:MAG: SRPBCC family protein, partial [Pseudonocardiaceae bacterium]
PNTLEPSTPGGGDTVMHTDSPWATRLRIPFREPIEPAVLSLTEQEKATLYGFFVFPGSSLAASGDQIIWLSLIPLSIDRTEVRGGVLMPSAMVSDEERVAIQKCAKEYAAVINAEDQRGLEAVQRAAGSRFTERGHLSPKEPGVLASYQNLARALLRGDDEWPGAL